MSKPNPKIYFDKSINNLFISTALSIIEEYINIIKKEPTILRLTGNFIILGDIHGTFIETHDLIERLIYHNILPTTRKLLFLGDYVDKGPDSTECILYLMNLKIRFPNHVYMLRGNHEDTYQNWGISGFYQDCCSKYTLNLYHAITMAYQWMSLCAIIALPKYKKNTLDPELKGDPNKDTYIFCVHAGFGPNTKLIHTIENMKKPFPLSIISTDDVISELLWSDCNPDITSFQNNTVRGIGFCYNLRHVDKFLKDNNMKFFVRGHTYYQKGFCKWEFHNIISLHTAENYLGLQCSIPVLCEYASVGKFNIINTHLDVLKKISFS